MNPADITDKAMRLKAEGIDPTYNDLVGEDLELDQLADLWLSCTSWKAAANLVDKVIGEKLAGILSAESRGVEVSGHFVMAISGTKWEKCIDPEGFWTVLLRDPDRISRYFNPNDARKGSLPPEVRDTFFEKGETPKPEAAPRPAAIPVQVLETRRNK